MFAGLDDRDHANIDETEQQVNETNSGDRLIASNMRCPFIDDRGYGGYQYIDVYASDNACYLYYAIVRGDRNETQYTVIENSGYGRDDSRVGFIENRFGTVASLCYGVSTIIGRFLLLCNGSWKASTTKNSIQTNLSLVTEEFIDLFLQYHVRPGFSLDGTKDIHDQQRVGINGQPTFDFILSKLALCREKGISPGCIVVAGKKHIGHIPELYNFMKENKLNFKFNPLFSAGEATNHLDEYGITPSEYAQMSIKLFDLWFDDNQGEITESNFVEIASNIVSKKTTGCMFGRNCQDNFFAIAPTGDVMPCGRFCDDDLLHYSYGNLHEETLSDILPRIKQSEIYMRSEYIEKSSCKHCKWLDICHGGCLHDGFLKSGDFRSKTFLCAAYKKIFAHIEKRMKEAGMGA